MTAKKNTDDAGTETATTPSILEVMAAAGDAAARAALGQPTNALAPRLVPNGTDGLEAGNTATHDVYLSTDGKVSKVAPGESPEPGFRGTQVVLAGDVVTAYAASQIAAG